MPSEVVRLYAQAGLARYAVDTLGHFDHFERVTGESCATTVAGP